MAMEQNPIQSNFSFRTVLSIVLLVVAVAGLFIFVFPKKDSFDLLKADLAEKETSLLMVKNELAKLQAVKESFTGGEVTQKDVLNMIPSDLQQGEIIRILAKHSEENEATINSLSFSLSQSKGDNYGVLTITTNVSGTHMNLLKFLQALEKDGRKFKVNTVSVQVLENGLENMSLNIEAYYL